MASHPEPYIRLPTTSHKTTLVILHGTSQTGPQFAEYFLSTLFSPPRAAPTKLSTTQEADKKVTFPMYFPSCRFVFPTGAPRKTTVFGGRETNAWFDITDFGDRTRGEMEMIDGIRESSHYLVNLIRDEIMILDDKTDKQLDGKGRLFLAGFSQGSAMGLMLLLSGELHRQGILHGFLGFIGLSGWLPFRIQIQEILARQYDEDLYCADGGTTMKRMNITAYVRDLLGLDTSDNQWTFRPDSLDGPVFIGHGELDVKVKYQWGLHLKEILRELEMNVAFKSYPGLQHWWDEQESRDIAKFLNTNWHGVM